jgi:uncharacterized protein involved in outer membrane biogenesis
MPPYTTNPVSRLTSRLRGLPGGLTGSARRHRGLLRKLAVAAAALVVVFAVAGFFIVPPVAKHYLVKGLSEKLGRPVAIESIRLNPFSLVAVVKGFSIGEPDGSARFVSFSELSVDLQAQSLFRLAPIVREVTLKDPYVHIVRNADGTSYNFSDIPGRFPAAPEAAAEPAEPARFSINNIRIAHGLVEVEDRPKDARHAVAGINVSIPFLSNLPYRLHDYVEPSFSAKFNGTPIALQGRTKPFQDALETSLDVNIDNLELSRYMEYLPADTGFRVKSGSLDTRITLTFVRPTGHPPSLWVKGDVALSRLGVTGKDGKPLLNLARLDVPITGINVFNSQYSFGTVALQQPEVFVRRDPDGSLNWMALVPPASVPVPAPENEKPPATVTLTLPELAIRDGVVHVADLVPDPVFRTDLTGIQIALREFALPQEQPAQVEIAFGTGFGESVKHAGSLLLSPLSSSGTLEARKIQLTRYFPYYRSLLLYQLEAGVADFSTRYALRMGGEQPDMRLDGFNFSLASARMRKPGADEDFLSVKSAQIRDAALDLGKLTMNVGEFSSREGVLNLVRERDGTINATRILPATEEARSEASTEERRGSPWLMTLARADLQKWRIAFTDLVPAEPVKIVADDLSLQARDVGNQPGTKGELELNAKLNESGSLSVQGPLSIDPLSTELKVGLQDFSVVTLQPYFANRLNILLTRADLSVAGTAKFALAGDAPPAIGFDGDVRVTHLASVDKAGSEDFLKWQSLHVGGVSYNHEPMRLAIQQVALSDFYSRIIIFPDGRLNLQDIVAADKSEAESTETKPAAPEKPADTAAPPPPIRIGAVTLQNGDVNFTDLFIKPNYSANLSAIGGSVTGLSSQLDTTADVDLRGRFAVTAPVEIKGKLNPLVKNLFLDIKANVRDIELGPFTPYSGKYVGYAIEKGKMSFDVAYRIEDRKLQASNRITVDQLTFGGKVESPEATKLPVMLAVALLKDRNGVIDVNLPISGSLDDPKFSVGGLIVRVIVNLITKAITSPFALLGSLAGSGGEELSYVEFEPGLATLPADSQDKISALQKGLADRPALKLDVMPFSDPETDREASRRLAFERQVKSQKMQDLVKRGTAVKSVDEVTVAPEEYEKYLRRAYKEAKFPKPRNAIGFVKDLPVDETEKLMLTNVQVSDDDLLKLANERAQAVKDVLTGGGEVAPERVFLVAPKLETPKPDDKRRGSRVDFSLK